MYVGRVTDNERRAVKTVQSTRSDPRLLADEAAVGEKGESDAEINRFKSSFIAYVQERGRETEGRRSRGSRVVS